MFQLYLLSLVIVSASQGMNQYDSLLQALHSTDVWEEKAGLYDSLASVAYRDNHTLYKKYVPLIIDETIQLSQYDFAAKHSIALSQIFYEETFAPDSALPIVDRALGWWTNVSEKNRALLIHVKGDYFFYKSEWDSAVVYYEKEIEIYERLKDSSQTNLTTAYIYAADINIEMGRHSKSTKQLEKAFLLAEYQKDTSNLFTILGLTANIYGGAGFLEKAAEYYEKAIALARKIKNKQYNYLYENYSNIASRLGKDSLELALLRTSLASIDTSNRSGEQARYMTYIRMTWALANQDHLDSALYYFKLAEKDNHKYSNVPWLQQLYSIAKAYALYSEGQHIVCIDSATRILDESKRQNVFGVTLEMENLIYKAYKAIGKYQMALEHYSNFADLRDSMFSVEKSSALAYLETEFEAKQKEQQISKQETEIGFLQAKSEFSTRLAWSIGIGALFLFGSIYLYRSRQYALKSKSMQEGFSRQLLASHEEERRRISRDLHDSVGQSLILIKNKISLNQDEATSTMVSQALEEVRSISKALHPEVLDKLGLTAAIQKFIHDADEATDIFFTDEIDPIDNIFTKEQELQIYRIVQEALNNLIKHAKTESALIRTQQDDRRVTILVQDFGIGFDITENHGIVDSLGMKTLKERTQLLGGRMRIDSTKNKGTTVSLVLSKPSVDQKV